MNEELLKAIVQKLQDFERHTHNGTDSQKVIWKDLDQRTILVPYTLVDTDAATAAKYGVIFTAPFPCTLVSARETHKTAGTNGGAVTVTLEKLTAGQALDAGVAMLQTALSLKTTIDTPQSGTLTDTTANLSLATGDRIALKDAGTLTDCNHVNIIIELKLI